MIRIIYNTSNYICRREMLVFVHLFFFCKVSCPYIKQWATEKIFCFLMLRGRILTQDVMRRRKMQCDLGCVMCGACPVESILHLLLLCRYAVHVWWIVSTQLGITLFKPNLEVELIWHQSMKAFDQSRTDNRKRVARGMGNMVHMCYMGTVEATKWKDFQRFAIVSLDTGRKDFARGTFMAKMLLAEESNNWVSV